MKSKIVMCVVALLMLLGSAVAQKEVTIAISDSLSIRADKLPVKMGGISVGINKFKFGEYSVDKAKASWETSTEKSKIFNRKTESSSKQKYYFELRGSTPDVARVNAVNQVESKALREWTLLSYTKGNYNFSIDEEAELLIEENSYSAFIILNNDTTEVWSLIMTTFKGSQVSQDYKPVALLSNGVRKIYLVPVTSHDTGEDKRKIPAYGYELRENNQALAALQFYGGGAWGGNKNIIWLPRETDPKMRLMLAAALTSVLNHKLDHMGF